MGREGRREGRREGGLEVNGRRGGEKMKEERIVMKNALFSCVISAHMVDLHTVKLDNVGVVEFLEEGDLMNNSLNGTCVLLLDGELREKGAGG